MDNTTRNEIIELCLQEERVIQLRKDVNRRLRFLRDRRKLLLESPDSKEARRWAAGEVRVENCGHADSVHEGGRTVKTEEERRREEVNRRLVQDLDAAEDDGDIVRILLAHGWRLVREKKGGVQ